MELNIDLVKSFLRIEHDADDIWLTGLISASKSFVESYLNRKLDDFEDGYPEEFDVARLYTIQQWYDQKAMATFNAKEKQQVDLVFSSILNPHRYIKFAFLGNSDTAYPNLKVEDGKIIFSLDGDGSYRLTKEEFEKINTTNNIFIDSEIVKEEEDNLG